jgi:2-polyprenyl-3-methyl-5-hydroxy-6-metoxy-1,4-benzoquinol methylase
MSTKPIWQWNEIQQVGTDYSDVAEVERYEKRMGEFRDLAAEDAAILELLAVPSPSRVLEIGTGSGHFARAAARAGHRVTAIDVSPAMLQYAQARAKAEGLSGMEFHHAGFLTFSAQPATYDAVVSVAVLHHLPDIWKAVALQNIRRLLKPGGLFALGDVVFSWSGEAHAACFEAFINACPEGVRQGAIGHASLEFSTLDWIMKGLLERSGLKILKTIPGKASFVQYLCQAPVGERP